MKKIVMTATFVVLAVSSLLAQDTRDREYRHTREESNEPEKKSFKEHLFTGGSIALGFSNNSFLVGGSPMFGYSLTHWADVGLVGNYTYTSYRNVVDFQDKLRQSVYGGGAFVKLYPVPFLFAQAQFENNFIREKYFPAGGGTSSVNTTNVNSMLLGAGFASGRNSWSGQPFFYVSILFDVLKNEFSPYTNSAGNVIPVFKAGIQVPLFQGGSRRDRF